jgi:hypothetical protein
MAKKKTPTKGPAKEPEQKIVDKVKQGNENGARRAILEDLFYDFHRSRRQVYWMNFIRGLFFGLGSVLGATLLVAVAIWLLGKFGAIFPALADFINNLIDMMQQRR